MYHITFFPINLTFTLLRFNRDMIWYFLCSYYWRQSCEMLTCNHYYLFHHDIAYGLNNNRYTLFYTFSSNKLESPDHLSGNGQRL